jgi:hypothetical protein
VGRAAGNPHDIEHFGVGRRRYFAPVQTSERLLQIHDSIAVTCQPEECASRFGNRQSGCSTRPALLQTLLLLLAATDLWSYPDFVDISTYRPLWRRKRYATATILGGTHYGLRRRRSAIFPAAAICSFRGRRQPIRELSRQRQTKINHDAVPEQ